MPGRVPCKKFKCPVKDCEQCELGCDTETSFIQHFELAHENELTGDGDRNPIIERLVSEAKKIYRCPHPNCEYKAVRKDYITTHERTHRRERQFPCPYPPCSYRGPQKKDLNNHVRAQHTKPADVKCEFGDGCNMVFNTREAMRQHGKRVHVVQKASKTMQEQGDHPHGAAQPLPQAHATTSVSVPNPADLMRSEVIERGESEIIARIAFQCLKPQCKFVGNSDQSLLQHLSLHSPQKYGERLQQPCSEVLLFSEVVGVEGQASAPLYSCSAPSPFPSPKEFLQL